MFPNLLPGLCGLRAWPAVFGELATGRKGGKLSVPTQPSSEIRPSCFTESRGKIAGCNHTGVLTERHEHFQPNLPGLSLAPHLWSQGPGGLKAFLGFGVNHLASRCPTPAAWISPDKLPGREGPGTHKHRVLKPSQMHL